MIIMIIMITIVFQKHREKGGGSPLFPPLCSRKGRRARTPHARTSRARASSATTPTPWGVSVSNCGRREIMIIMIIMITIVFQKHREKGGGSPFFPPLCSRKGASATMTGREIMIIMIIMITIVFQKHREKGGGSPLFPLLCSRKGRRARTPHARTSRARASSATTPTPWGVSVGNCGRREIMIIMIIMITIVFQKHREKGGRAPPSFPFFVPGKGGTTRHVEGNGREGLGGNT